MKDWREGEDRIYISPIHTFVNIPAPLLKNTLRFLIRAGSSTKVWIGDMKGFLSGEKRKFYNFCFFTLFWNILVLFCKHIFDSKCSSYLWLDTVYDINIVLAWFCAFVSTQIISSRYCRIFHFWIFVSIWCITHTGQLYSHRHSLFCGRHLWITFFTFFNFSLRL